MVNTLEIRTVISISSSGNGSSEPVEASNILAESGDDLITESGDNLIT